MPTESELLEGIYERSRSLASSFGEIIVGPGDDAAVVRTPGSETLLLTTDQLVEGRHYDAGTPVELVARKAIARAVSDIAAMGGRPAWALATGVLPPGYARGDALCAALAKWAQHWDCPLVGGDLAFGSERLVLGVTIAGRMEDGHEPVLRSGARPGDLVWLTGPVGGAVESGRHLEFEPRLEAGRTASRRGSGVRAMIDLSDGLGRDAGRLARASGVVLEIRAERIPVRLPDARDWRRAVGGGEDYELLMSAAPASEEPVAGMHRIGRVRARAEAEGEPAGAWVIEPSGERHDVSELGWDHGSDGR